MANIVNISDFVGFYLIPQSTFNNGELQDYCDMYEQRYLTELLGTDLYDLLIADLVAGVPQDPDYLLWFNPFSYEPDFCYNCLLTSNGVKNMLLGFIYYQFMWSQIVSNGGNGFNIPKNENNDTPSLISSQSQALRRYNDAVVSYNAIKMRVNGTINVVTKETDIAL